MSAGRLAERSADVYEEVRLVRHGQKPGHWVCASVQPDLLSVAKQLVILAKLMAGENL